MSDVVLKISHRTTYEYERTIRASKNEVRMTPAGTHWQKVVRTQLTVSPTPTHRVAYRDYFGTAVEFFEVTPPHDHLDVIAESEVRVAALASSEFPSPDPRRSVEYLPQSPMTIWDAEVSSLAKTLRRDDAGATVRATIDWMRSEMTYQPGFTEVGTPVVDVLAARRGVCQDYVHLCCALLRSNGIPARYVSGYFAPTPLEPGDSVEAQSHAWVEALPPDSGLMPVDPTNDIEPAARHVKVGHGRDYSDVPPFLGVHMGVAAQTLDVGVTIQRLR